MRGARWLHVHTHGKGGKTIAGLELQCGLRVYDDYELHLLCTRCMQAICRSDITPPFQYKGFHRESRLLHKQVTQQPVVARRSQLIPLRNSLRAAR